jgi:hypothetical protein
MSYGQSNNAIAGDKTSDYGKWVWPVRDSPDLVIGELRAPSACVGQTIAINDTILNTGKLPAGPSTTKYFLSDRAVYYDQAVLLGSRAISAIAGGSSQSGTTVVTIPPTTPVGPAHFIIARADANGAVAEGNETNNDASHAINIVGPGPDLAIINLWVCRDTNGKAFMGARVESEGVSPAGKAKIKFYVSRKRALDATAVYLGSAEVPPLAIHGIATPIISAATFPTDIPVDNAYVIGHLETSPMSHECNEENNTFIKQFKVERCSSVPAAKPQKGILR